jgi:outer membrane protein assembly factor BamB
MPEFTLRPDRIPRRALGLLAVWVAIVHGAVAAEPTLRYFRWDGGVAGADAGPLPSRFDTPDARRWRVTVGAGHSTPILCSNRLFLTSCDPASRALITLAVAAESGQLLWQRLVEAPRLEQTHTLGSPATATPACDGQRLYVFFGSYGLICYDLDGAKVWEQRLGPFQDEYGAGSSPVLVQDKVVLNQDHDLDSFVAAFDRASGRLVWRTPRPDAVRSYSTPAVWTRGDRQELLVAGALELASYDPASGAKLWTVQGLARIVIPTPVPQGERVFMASWAPGGDAGRRLELVPWTNAVSRWDRDRDGQLARTEVDDAEVLDRFYRMDLDQNGRLSQAEWERHAAIFRRAQNALLALEPRGRGDLTETALVWKHARGAPYVATPLLDQGRLWMVKDGGIVTKLDAASGRVLQEERLPALGSYFASPAAGAGKVYFASEPGVVSVVANEAEWRVLATHDFREPIYATPVIAGDRIWIRTKAALYCFDGRAR